MKKKVLIGVVVVLLVIAGYFVFFRGGSGTLQAESTYDIEKLEKKNLVDSISSTGTFESTQAVSVSSVLSGCKIKEINIEAGDEVKKGEIICTFDPEDIKKSLAQAKQSLENTKKQNNISRRSAERKLSDAKISKRDQYDYATKNIKNAKANWEDAIKERDNLKNQYQKAVKLGDAASKATLENQYEAAKSNVKSLKKIYDSAVQERKSADKSNASTVKAMQDSLESTKVSGQSNLDSVKNQVDTYTERLQNTVVKAEKSGVVTSINLKAGQTYSGGDICVIENPDDFIITSYIEEYNISDISRGMKVKVKTEATGNEVLDATVDYVSKISAASSNTSSSSLGNLSSSSSSTSLGSSNVTYEIKVRLDKPNNRIRIGMTAKMSIVIEEVKDVYAVPYDAVQEKDSGKKVIYCETTEADGSKGKEEIEVTTGLETDYYVEVSGAGLKDGLSVMIISEDSGAASFQDMMQGMRRNS